jgi:hypothetical protein
VFKASLNGQTINLIDDNWKDSRNFLKESIRKHRYLCPQCKQGVVLHWAEPAKKIPHFKHRVNNDCTYGSGESEEHNMGKLNLYNYFRKKLLHKINFIDVEHFIPETGQIADVFIEFKNGKRWVIEYQRSNISTEEINSRKFLYKNAGILDIWIAGENLVGDNGLVTRSILNAAQSLIYTDLFDELSLVTYDPIENKLSLLRGLENQNQLTYTFNNIFTYRLQDICFNPSGEAFCFNDFLKIKTMVENNNDVNFKYSTSTPVELSNAKLLNPNYYKATINNTQHFFKMPSEVWEITPIEMTELYLFFDLKMKPESYSDETNPLKLEGVLPSKWLNLLENRNSKQNEIPFEGTLLRTGFMFALLIILYEKFFRTESEFEKELSSLLNGRQVPNYIYNDYLKSVGVIENNISKDTFGEIQSLEGTLELFLKLMGIRLIHKDITKQAVELGILKANEIDEKVKVHLYLKIYERVERYLSEHIIPPVYKNSIVKTF